MNLYFPIRFKVLIYISGIVLKCYNTHYEIKSRIPMTWFLFFIYCKKTDNLFFLFSDKSDKIRHQLLLFVLSLYQPNSWTVFQILRWNENIKNIVVIQKSPIHCLGNIWRLRQYLGKPCIPPLCMNFPLNSFKF